MSIESSPNFSPISSILKDWYNTHKRDLPWRRTSDPYFIWLSEVILQQTRVDQGLDYYSRFVSQYPNVKSLADASEDEVMKLWQGLGYYSRARNLHTTAKIIANDYNGIFPSDYKTILSLKGIGEYTAAAISSFSFNVPVATVDGNVFRVLSRLFAIDTPIDTSKGKKVFTETAQEILDKNNPGLHNQAMMEFGALQCVPVSPKCSECPLSHICLAYSKNEVSKFPVKQGKTTIKSRYFNYFDVRYEDYIYLKKREENDIWRNLYELPLIETSEKKDVTELMTMDIFTTMFPSDNVKYISKMTEMKHILSHRVIFANFFKIEIRNDEFFEENYIKVKVSDIEKYAISRLVHKYLEKFIE